MTIPHMNVINWNLARFAACERDMERYVLANRDEMATLAHHEATRYMRNVERIESLYR